MKIYKYDIEVTSCLQKIAMPEGAKILSMQAQNDSLKMWAIVDPEKPLENRWFQIHATGHEITEPDDKEYLFTAQVLTFVWHLFEYKETEVKQ